MAPTNIILNGDFSSGAANWSGTDIEASYGESAYIGTNPGNTVAEMDGQSGQTTVMEQSFSINNAMSTTLTFDTALRTASNGNAGSEGFRVEILDSVGTVIATQEYYPTANSLGGETLNVTFPGADTYTLRFTELGGDDSLGAIVDNISMLVCFVAGTKIRTESGEIAVENLLVGDLVWTLDRGYQPVRWINSRKVSIAEQLADERLCPIRFKSGAIDCHQKGDLLVSPQHRMLRQGFDVARMFAIDQVLISAVDLLDGNHVVRVSPKQDQTYVHFMFDQHEIVEANGVLSESFFPGAPALNGVCQEARRELFQLFPELGTKPEKYGKTARTVLKAYEARLLQNT